jgi:DNA-binding winged helix-turn-helix (wHTH) protein
MYGRRPSCGFCRFLEHMQPVRFCFGEFELDPAARELCREGQRIDLPGSAFDGLVYLIQHRDRAVGRDELMAAIWGRADVADSLLGQTLVRLRRALGDSGDQQQWIRTVPRFGYRWIGAVQETTPAAATAPVVHSEDVEQAPAASVPEPRLAEVAEEPALAPVPSPAAVQTTLPPQPRTRLYGGLALAFGLAMAIVIALLLARPAAPPATTTPPRAATALRSPALVLPAQIGADEEWAWLRLGLMDLVASRLRRGELATAASESVVALLREHAGQPATALLEGDALDGDAALRILPEAEQQDGQWLVRLRARDSRRQIVVETRAADAISAAREAADTLLLRLGHLPPDSRDEAPQALTELLQRTRAAMLADQLQLAGELIRRAEPALRARPEIALREAQIELRAGDYLAVEQRLLRLLDAVPAARDPELRGRALVTLAASYIRRDLPVDAARHYDEAISLLRERKAPDALGLALLGRGLVATLRADYDAALADLGLARSEMESAGNPLGMGQVDLNLGLIDVLRLRPATALSTLEDAAARFQRLGAQEEYVFTLASIAEVQQLLLDHAAALATTERYWPPDEHSQNLRLRWKLSLVRAQALAETGRLEAAGQLATRILRDSDVSLDQAIRAETAALQAQLAAARGARDEAAQLAQAALTPMLETADSCRYVQTWMLRLRALRASGGVDQAARETAALGDWVAKKPDPWRELYARLARAEQTAAEGDSEAALAAFAAALRQADAAGAIPDDLAEVIHVYADQLIRAGQLDLARGLSARIAPWADRDLRVARVFVQINTALGQPQALQSAERRAEQLAGERRMLASGQ